MKKGLLIIVAIIVVIAGLAGCSYNPIVSKEETVKKEWGNVQNTYQLRADKIPNLVATVKGAAAHEKNTLEAVMAARAKATQVTVNADDLSPEAIQKYQAAQGELSQALGRLMMVQENYPDLKANQNFLSLQDEISGIENRIKVARDNFNTAVNDYNSSIRKFPANITAMIFGFKTKGYFEAEAGAQSAPKVEF
ncbi:MAG: LemA family protein [Taibaiella sp.]|jgi:LemA protein|nr:LemA family protein [Taibaiella sp.]